MRLFISYASVNRKIVHQLYEDLSRAGHQVWYDRGLSGLKPGDNWWQEILSEIEKCEAFVFALSPHSTASTACQAEYQYALDLNKPILPILLKTAELPFGSLQEIHYVDARHLDDKATALEMARGLFSIQDKIVQGKYPPRTPPRPSFPFKKDALENLRHRDLRDTTQTTQAQIVFELRELVRNGTPHEKAEASAILQNMLNSPYITRSVEHEIREALTSNRSKWIALTAALLAMMGIAGILWGLLGQNENNGKAIPSATMAEVALEPTATDAPSQAAVEIATQTETPTNTFSPIPPTDTPTYTPTLTMTHTPSNTPTLTATHIPSNTPTHTATYTPTHAPTNSRTPTRTATSRPPSPTATSRTANVPVITNIELNGTCSNYSQTIYWTDADNDVLRIQRVYGDGSTDASYTLTQEEKDQGFATWTSWNCKNSACQDKFIIVDAAHTSSNIYNAPEISCPISLSDSTKFFGELKLPTALVNFVSAYSCPNDTFAAEQFEDGRRVNIMGRTAENWLNFMIFSSEGVLFYWVPSNSITHIQKSDDADLTTMEDAQITEIPIISSGCP